MPSSLDLPPLKWDPTAEIRQKIPVYSGVSETRHPALVPFHRDNIANRSRVAIEPDKHPTALAAYATAIDGQHGLYRGLSVLADSRTVLSRFTIAPGPGKTPPADTAVANWNQATSDYHAVAGRAYRAARDAHDRAETQLAQVQERLQTEITNGITVSLAPEVKQEIRAFLAAKGKTAESELRGLVNSGDLSALTAVRSAPAFLSGLTNEQVETLGAEAAQKHFPDKVFERDIVGEMRAFMRATRTQLDSAHADNTKYATPVASKRPLTFSETPRARA